MVSRPDHVLEHRGRVEDHSTTMLTRFVVQQFTCLPAHTMVLSLACVYCCSTAHLPVVLA
jgi:hypothetical protein